MTTPTPSPHPTPERGSAATTAAYRFWRLQGNRVVSPLAGTPLPDSGTLHADCTRPHLAPNPTCVCGIAVYLSAEDVLRAFEAFELDPEQFVVSDGLAERPLISDQHSQLYNVGGIPKAGPTSYRARSYTVLTFYTDTVYTAKAPNGYDGIFVNYISALST
ncbi:hypothetical protein PDG61_19230 [Mycolicibacterium sp. BiH015]|uniref:hypothetical protein n=1 Tax=Mycolicibacterium sp. BiH015 TaxID=3018808 RepID=UPI0022E6315B|nr:hypothetical protein [Mycolicibacterium sp. BiH015]MDA2893063.1 hypothetical protein [Mycolicibacterium sp. BiH015]